LTLGYGSIKGSIISRLSLHRENGRMGRQPKKRSQGERQRMKGKPRVLRPWGRMMKKILAQKKRWINWQGIRMRTMKYKHLPVSLKRIVI